MKILQKIIFSLLNFILLTVLVFFVHALWDLVITLQNISPSYTVMNEEREGKVENDHVFLVYQKDILKKTFVNLEDAVLYAQNFEHSFVKEKNKSRWLWNNYPPFNVYQKDQYLAEFETYLEAVAFARAYDQGYVYYRGNDGIVWSAIEKVNDSVIIEVPFVKQMPELPRGCEVTSLSMLLMYEGVEVDKMTLAEQVRKDPTPYEVKKGKAYFGNPYEGFLGSMTDMKKPGYGVYHGPVYELLKKYLPDRALDITGCEFEDVLFFIEKHVPVWIITNTSYSKLRNSEFFTWQSPSGVVQVTKKQHAVLITGYDYQFIYINDPLYHNSNRKLPKKPFEEAWIQMGRQAVTYSP
jgi:uncharacterized protein YvpB